jgi:hypothetical protein
VELPQVEAGAHVPSDVVDWSWDVYWSAAFSEPFLKARLRSSPSAS